MRVRFLVPASGGDGLQFDRNGHYEIDDEMAKAYLAQGFVETESDFILRLLKEGGYALHGFTAATGQTPAKFVEKARKAGYKVAYEKDKSSEPVLPTPPEPVKLVPIDTAPEVPDKPAPSE